MSLQIVKKGMLTSIQDLGRRGYQKYGVIESGAMDHFSMKCANLLVGNEMDEATMEITILGPTIYFESNALISICGGDLSATVEGISVPLWRPVLMKAGSTLKIGPAKSKIRAYLAVAGGFDLPKEMGSRSTYLRAEIGGFYGRALQEGDKIKLRNETPISQDVFSMKLDGHKPFLSCHQSISYWLMPSYSNKPMIRVIRGSEFELFTEESQQKFLADTFKVLPQSDRMGYRLEGPGLSLTKDQDMVSDVVSFGTVQVPANGQPIVLMADHQTTGGYPKIAQVISVDLPIMAQLNLGAEVHFEEVSLIEAQRLFVERESELLLAKHGMLKILENIGGHFR